MKLSRHSSPYAARLKWLRRPTKAAKIRGSATILAAAVLPFFSFAAQALNTADVVIANTSLTTPANFSLLATPTGSNDVLFAPGYPTAATTFTISSTNATYGSLNDTNAFAITIQTGSAGTSSITLGGTQNTGNSVAPSTSDLFYVGLNSSLTLQNGTGTLNVILGQSGNFDVVGMASIASIISDGGNGYAITKTGAGTLTLSGANTFSGGLNLNAGTVSIGAVNNLGTGTVSFGGGTLAITAAVDPSVQFSQAANQAYSINNSAATTFATALTSVGGTLTKSGAGVLTSTAANTFTGATVLNVGALALSGAGSLASTTLTLQGGGLTLTNTGAGNNAVNRLADTATINLGGGAFVLGGSDQASTNVAETVGSFVLSMPTANVGPVITVAPGSNAAPGVTTLTATSITRSAGNNVALVNGVSLGGANSQFFLTTAPMLVGTAPTSTTINASSQSTGIVPGLVGEVTVGAGGAGTATGVANTFLTYTSTGGLRPLSLTDEFTNNATTTGNNIYVTANTTATSNTVNSLVLAGAATAPVLTIGTGITLTDTSGMVLFGGNATNKSFTVSGAGTLAFGANEAIVSVDAGVTGTISTAVTGTGGLTKAGTGSLILTGTNTATATTNVDGGSLVLQSSAAQGATVTNTTVPTGATVNVAGGASLGLTNTIAGSPIPVVNYNNFTTNLNGGATLFYGNGNIAQFNLPGNVVLTGTNTISSSNIRDQLTLGGVVSGTGNLVFSAGGAQDSHFLVLSNANTYSGNTTISAGAGGASLLLSGGADRLPTTTVVTITNAGTASIYSQLNLGSQNQTLAGLVSGGTAANDAVVNTGSGTPTLTLNVASGAQYTYAGILGGTNAVPGIGTNSAATQVAGNGFALVKSGAGTQVLSGTNLYTGGTTINGGRLLVTNGAALGASTGGVTIGSGANSGTLATSAGTLTIPNLITTSGTGSVLAPGATAVTNNGAVGALTLSGGLNLAAGATLAFDLGATQALSDKINITGAFTGATDLGTVTFAFNNLDVPTGVSTTYALISYTASSTGVDLGDFTATGVAGTFQFNGSELDFVTAVPEPATYIGGLVLTCVFGWSLRFRRQQAVA